MCPPTAAASGSSSSHFLRRHPDLLRAHDLVEDRGPAAVGGDVRALAGPDLYDAEEFQGEQGLADRQPAHPRHFREIAVRRKAVARTEVTVPDRLQNLKGDRKVTAMG